MIFLLDTNILIDGRIVKLAKTGLLDGVIFIPEYVVSELALMADSGVERKANLAKLGMETVQKLLSEEAPIRSQIINWDHERSDYVDHLLIETAKSLKAILITMDGGVQGRCRCAGVKFIALNEIFDSLKPSYKAGMTIDVLLTAKGKVRGQALSYTPEGTLVVVEEGEPYLGRTAKVEVSNLLINKNGQMIFAKLMTVGPEIEAP